MEPTKEGRKKERKRERSKGRKEGKKGRKKKGRKKGRQKEGKKDFIYFFDRESTSREGEASSLLSREPNVELDIPQPKADTYLAKPPRRPHQKHSLV